VKVAQDAQKEKVATRVVHALKAKVAIRVAAY